MLAELLGPDETTLGECKITAGKICLSLFVFLVLKLCFVYGFQVSTTWPYYDFSLTYGIILIIWTLPWTYCNSHCYFYIYIYSLTLLFTNTHFCSCPLDTAVRNEKIFSDTVVMGIFYPRAIIEKLADMVAVTEGIFFPLHSSKFMCLFIAKQV